MKDIVRSNLNCNIRIFLILFVSIFSTRVFLSNSVDQKTKHKNKYFMISLCIISHFVRFGLFFASYIKLVPDHLSKLKVPGISSFVNVQR